MSGTTGIGIIGAGMISEQYLTNLTVYPDITVHVIGDLDVERAKAQAERWGVALGGDVDAVLAHPDVDIVINLTIPAAHEQVSIAALQAGKHVWTEKPLAVDRAAGRRILDAAEAAGRRVGCAPDTVLGPGFQTAKRVIAEGLIGTPYAAATGFQWQGPDVVHPNPDFLFAHGGGPLFDMGPYYFAGLTHLFGSVSGVAALGGRAALERSVQVGPRAGETFPVEVPTHLSVLTEFAAGQQAQSLLSFDTAIFRHGVFEVHGTEGSLVLPDPNYFTGAIQLYRPAADRAGIAAQQPEPVPVVGAETGRGLGALDMARAIAEGRDHLATGELGYHVLDVLESVAEAVEARGFVDVTSRIETPAAMPADFDPFARTL